jgi:hypothetical protein
MLELLGMVGEQAVGDAVDADKRHPWRVVTA